MRSRFGNEHTSLAHSGHPRCADPKICSSPRCRSPIVLRMAETTVRTAPSASGTFADVLASLARKGSAAEVWDDSLLADDVANIRYEAAPPSPGYMPKTSRFTIGLATEAVDCAPKRTASITIRLTSTEQKQLQERAAEAKLTVSAYLRSCVFEAESLRAQVKEALSEMRAATVAEGGDLIATPASRRGFGLLSRWMHRRAKSA